MHRRLKDSNEASQVTRKDVLDFGRFFLELDDEEPATEVLDSTVGGPAPGRGG